MQYLKFSKMVKAGLCLWLSVGEWALGPIAVFDVDF